MITIKSIAHVTLLTGLILTQLSCSKSNDDKSGNSGDSVQFKTNSTDVELLTSSINEKPNSQNLVKLNPGTDDVYYTLPAQNEESVLHIVEVKIKRDGQLVKDYFNQQVQVLGGTYNYNRSSGEFISLNSNTIYKLKLNVFGSSTNKTVDLVAVRVKVSEFDSYKTQIQMVRNCVDSVDKSKSYKVIFNNNIGGRHNVFLQDSVYTRTELGRDYSQTYKTEKICGVSIDPTLTGSTIAIGEANKVTTTIEEAGPGFDKKPKYASFTTDYNENLKTLQFTCEIKDEKILDIKMVNCEDKIEAFQRN